MTTEKIIIDTGMKEIPETCTKCKYSYCAYWNTGDRFCGVAFKNKDNIPIDKVFVKEKRNWVYVRPDWCPLKKIDVEMTYKEKSE